MPSKSSGWGKFAQLVPNHVLRDVHRDEFIAVVDGQRMADEIGRDRRTPRPRLDDCLVARAIEILDLARQMPVNKGAFFN